MKKRNMVTILMICVTDINIFMTTINYTEDHINK